MEKKKILVRLPNWLGDMVMAVGAVRQLPRLFPEAEISVVVKKGLQDLLPFFPPIKHSFVFSKEEYSSVKGLWRFGRIIRQTERFDLLISFPDSFSSALMGYATGTKIRIGYKNEGRNILLTNAYVKPKGLHRAEEYAQLLALYSGTKTEALSVVLQHHFPKQDYIVININSEASSRRLTVAKAVEIISVARESFSNKIFLIGGQKEKEFVETVFQNLPNKTAIESLAGKTTLTGLVQTLASARLVLTTDSGPAHLANALGTQTVVLFGAGNENNTAPYNKAALRVIRLGKLSCEPCTRNTCVQFGTPQCLELLDTAQIIHTVKQQMEHAG